MALVLDPIYVVNLALCTIIVALGYMAYKKSGRKVPLLIGAGFGLFGISHLATILDMKAGFETALIAVRTLGYIAVAFALYRLWKH